MEREQGPGCPVPVPWSRGTLGERGCLRLWEPGERHLPQMLLAPGLRRKYLFLEFSPALCSHSIWLLVAVTGSFGSALSVQVCLPHLNSGLSLPSCGHPRAQDLKQAQVGEEGDQEPRGDSGGTGGVAAQVSPELAAGAMSAQSPAWGSFRDCILAPSSVQGHSSCRCFPSAAAASSHLRGGSVAARWTSHH